MRRAGNLWPQVTSFENLVQAAGRAALGKRSQSGIARFLERLEPNVLALQHDLETETYRPGPSSRFTLYDPKERTITVAPFRDRVVHHALIDVLEPLVDRRMVFESFACRRGKGTHAALAHAQRLLRLHPWFLKLDVRRFFDSVVHDVVQETMARIVKDRPVLRLIRRILAGGDSPGRPGVGLPLGNLTSQWFANLVLDRLDHHVKERLGAKGYVRYMDDVVLFAHAPGRLRELHDAVGSFLGELRLTVKKERTLLAPSTQGLPFLGWRLYARHRRLRPENKRRALRRLKRRLWEYHHGRVDEEQLAACTRSLVAHLAHGDTLALRRRWCEALRDRAPPA